MTMGLYVKGPAVIWFEHLSDDSNGKELRRLLDLVHSAEPLDGPAVLALKLAFAKATCEERFPQFKREHEAALAASIFSAVNPAQLLQSGSRSSQSAEEIAAEIERAKVSFAKEFDQQAPQQRETFCQAFPKQVAEAER